MTVQLSERDVIGSLARKNAQGVALSAQIWGYHVVMGTVGMEILWWMTGPIEAIVVSVGGGGLIAVVAAYVGWVLPQVKIIGCQCNNVILHLDQRAELDQAGGFAGGGAVMEIDDELLESIVTIAVGALCEVVRRRKGQAHAAAHFLYGLDLNRQNSEFQAPISGPLFHSHQDYARVNFHNSFNDFVSVGANLEYNGLKGELAYRVHDPGMAMATMENVEQQWRTLANSLIVGKNDSENQMVTASIFFPPDDKMKAPLVDFLGRISEFGVLAEGLMNNRSKNCPRISPVDLFVMASSSTLFVVSWFPP
ncbi:uncharacterized protein LOC121810478 [Salvia splendens]|uniref:uncharacterized protein LOC121810478 n=1 Tax=Salvia splendens TaxID=180675 RepID=UPI001C270A56|nr:uncharacterized protein LOC121810478 [Salvia splendens]